MSQLIERDFPFARLSTIAEHESWRKEVHRPVYYIHKWWARRLGSVFRGIVLGACLDDGNEFWDRFYGRNTFDNMALFDPFMGSGVTVGEALKLGCRAVGRDINPVAYLACRAAFSRYSHANVLRVYQNMEKTLAPKLLSYFNTKTSSGEDAIVLYYFLVKVVPCPSCGKTIDLFKRRIFSENAVPGKDPSARSVCPACGGIASTFYNAEHVLCPHCSLSYNPQEGNVSGPNVQCGFCRTSFRLVDAMKSIREPLGFRRYAKMILTKEGQKRYETLNEFDLELEKQVAAEFVAIANTFPKVPIEPGYNTDQMLKHNYRFWHQLFSDRQLVCISHMVNTIRAIDDPDLRLLFACLFSGVLEFNNLFTSFKGEGTGAVRHMFAHHVLKPEMMPLEANIWGTSKSSGAFSGLFHSRVERALAYKANPTELKVNSSKATTVGGINHPLDVHIAGNFAEFISHPNSVYLSCGDSSCVDIPDKSVDLVVTDPPFFDNVHYSQLADFFYYWLRQTLDLSDGVTTRSAAEVQDTDSERFTAKLTSVFAECARVLRDDGLFIFTYHHSRHEGWTAVHRAIRHSGFFCIQSYPIKAEMSVAMPLRQAKSPIHLDLILVCRRHSGNQPDDSGTDAVFTALDLAGTQISSLRKAGIKLSLGDAKVILMGRFLCEAHKMRNLQVEARFLEELEQDIDTYVSQVILSKGEVLYEVAEPVQLTLFEEMGEYLANRRLQRTTNRRR
jgi:putative DNA methylase